MFRYKSILTCFFFFCSLILFGQTEFTVHSKKAIKHFLIAYDAYNKGQDDIALDEVNKAIDAADNFIEAYLLKANIFDEGHQFEQELDCFYKAIAIDPDFSPIIYFNAATYALILGRYDSAVTLINKFLECDTLQPSTREKAVHLKQNADFGSYALKHPVPFNPVNLGDGVNSEYDDYWPSLSADEQTLVFTRLIPLYDRFPFSPKNSNEDFFISYKLNGEWTQATNIGPPLNTEHNEGAQSLSSDGKSMYFTACKRPDGYGSCDIYYSEKIGNRWSKAINIGPPVNTENWESQPSISSDGRTLYFVRGKDQDNPTDIYRSQRKSDGTWSVPENLGDSINTPYREFSPFIHPDNKTLYFSSEGWPGMGGFDIFVSRKKESGGWTTPVNLGYPINTISDEIGFIVNAKGNMAMFSSDRIKSNRIDIYQFELYVKARPDVVTYVKGKVFDSETKEKLKARFQLIDVETNKVVIDSWSRNVSGEYLVCLPINKNYALNVSKEGYLFYSANFSLIDRPDPAKPYQLDVPLQPVQVGKTVVLKNIFFDTDLFTLKKESVAELDKLYDFLVNNPRLSIEISGHTDNQGSDEHNLTLSKNRAKAVYDYLVNKGIQKEKLSYEGYSFSKPIDSNDTEQGRANNRRTEFRIVKIN